MLDGALAVADLPEWEAELQAFEEPVEHWSDRFKYELYDWSHPDWLARDMSDAAYRWEPLLLTKGYFSSVLPEQKFGLLANHQDGRHKKFVVNVQVWSDAPDRIRAVYAHRWGRKCFDEPPRVYLHRELTRAIWAPYLDRVDHKNGWGLDNRGSATEPVNLRYMNADDGACSVNIYNQPTINKRRTHYGLPVGVEPRGDGRFCGQIGIKVGRGKKVARRSQPFWTIEEATAWYQTELERITGYKQWVHNPETITFPKFPPLLKPSSSYGRHADELEEIPF